MRDNRIDFNRKSEVSRRFGPLVVLCGVIYNVASFLCLSRVNCELCFKMLSVYFYVSGKTWPKLANRITSKPCDSGKHRQKEIFPPRCSEIWPGGH